MDPAPQSSARDVLAIEVITSPFVRFAKMEAAGGILLLLSTVAALIWANSPWEHSYHAIWDTPLSIGFGPLLLTQTRHEWINDGLMAAFFFLVGLEIKREVLIGELSSLRQAAFPLIAAVGGTVVPALIYISVNRGTLAAKGWGVPMATDIAFALGVLVLLGDRVPAPLKIFVAALAIVDDIFAVLVIAVFYTDHINFISLAIAAVGLGVSFLANVAGVRKPAFYAAIGVCVWFAVLKSGVHATIAGVLLAFTIPARTYINREYFLTRGRWLLDQFAAARPNSFEEHAAIHSLEVQCELVEFPLHRIEHKLQPWVSFLVMPAFAFANAGVHVFGKGVAALTHSVTIGVLLGLFLGKPLGIFSFAWGAARMKLAQLPPAVTWLQVFGASWLCGIGFTMSLFIAGLAFGEGEFLDLSKIAIIAASIGAGACGSYVLIRSKRAPSALNGDGQSSVPAAGA